MMRLLVGMMLAAFVSTSAIGQTAEPRPTFEVADVHAASQSVSAFSRTSLRGERYEMRNANMVDLIRTAYSVDADKVLGGPSWLEFDRFDVTARVPRNTSQETLKLMLQSLLGDRFKLAIHNDTQPIAGLVLSVGKGKPKLKEADASGKTGCQPQPVPPPPPTPGKLSVPMMGISCHNITMEAFAAELKGGAGGGYVTNVVVDSTGLKGAWDFDFRFTNRGLLQIVGSDGVTLADALDKQLGLKLEEQKLPTSVIVVDKVNETPSPNPPDLAQKLPPPPPAEFEVADIKPTNTSASPQSIIAGGIGVQPSGRVNLPGMLYGLKQLIILAWTLSPNEDIAGAPKWLDSAKFDVIAKVPAGFMSATGAAAPLVDLAPMFQALLIDRFKLKSHFEDQLVTAYTMVAAKPKLKKADPSTRTGCKTSTSPLAPPTSDGFPPLPTRTMTCQNMTMAQLAGQLQNFAGQYVHYPVMDATGLEGGWDFSFSFSPIPASQLAGLRGANPFGGGGGAPAASDPVGGTSLFDAFEKQLGLKLEAQKRKYPVFVIDHIEEKPTEN
jgi:uncharacterized protein (TIGR03435 family)